MIRLHEHLKAGKFPSCSQLSREAEVSPRTIKRDVDFMRHRLNLPIEYSTKHGGYRYTDPVDKFPSLPITEAEIFALLVAHKAIAQYQGSPFEQPLQTAFRKLTAQLDQQHTLSLGHLEQTLSFHPFAPDETDLDCFQNISLALQDRRVVRFFYKNLGAEKALSRLAHPYHLACVDNRWYLIAHDVSKNALRNFALSRIHSVTLTAESFNLPATFTIETHLKGSFGIFQSTGDFEVVVDFDVWAGQLVRERKWHSSQELTPLSDGGFRLSLHLNSLAEVERWLLSWGTHATVRQPVQLRHSLQKISQEMSQRYSTP